MLPDSLNTAYFIAAALFGLAGVSAIVAGIAALVKAKTLPFTVRTLVGMVLLALGALAGLVAAGMHGYKTLTREEVAGRLFVRPDGVQRYTATFRYPDGREMAFALAGDEIYVDAHILKWKPMANMLGLHTAYELDRVAGRYRAIEQERNSPRTVYSLGQTKVVDLFGLRQRYAMLSPLLDTQYGSATFVPVTRAAELELRVSVSGLLIREVSKP